MSVGADLPAAAGPDALVWRWAADGPLLSLTDGVTTILPSGEEIYGLVFEGARHLRGAAVEIQREEGDPTFSRYPARLAVRVRYDTLRDGPVLSACLLAITPGGDAELGPVGAQSADHVLVEGRWYPFARGAFDQLRADLAAVGIADGGDLSLRQYLELRKLAGSRDWIVDETGDGRPPASGVDLQRTEASLISFRGKLYPYQQDGWRWLSYIWQEGLGAILADEMGLGKTIQIIALLASPERDAAAPSLIVAPTTLLENWRREIGKFADGLKVRIHQGADRTGDYRVLLDQDVVVTSYETVVRDGSMFRMIDWRIVVLDEAQAIKNPDAKRTRAIKELRRRTGIAVTGTPMENRVRDLWSLADFAIPGYLGDVADFEARFNNDEGGAADLEPLISPIMLRRLVSEVATDLPEMIRIPQAIALAENEAARYEIIRQETLAEYGAAGQLVALSRLRMFCTHPMLLDDVEWSLDEAMGFSKTRRLVEIIDEVFARRQKMLVFTSYNRMAALIVRIVRERYGAFAGTINGDTPVTDRQPMVDRFTEEAGPALLALNPRAAGAGLNITAATHVVHYNLEWNPAIEDQASARAYRRGQTRPVTIHRLYFASSVEEVVNERLDFKRGVAGAAVVGVAGTEGDRADIAKALRISPVSAR